MNLQPEEHHPTPLSSAKDKLPMEELFPQSPREQRLASNFTDYIWQLSVNNELKWDFKDCKVIGLQLWRISRRSE